NYKGSQWIIKNLIDAVAKGGSFMVGIGPDGDGRFHPAAIAQLEETGRWLSVNGEGIYNTRPRRVWQEDDIRFTQSKDGRTVYAFTNDLSGMEIRLKSVPVQAGTKVSLLGYNKPLKWEFSNNELVISVPKDLLSKMPPVAQEYWTFKIEE
ncbi:MAG: alpha-L-fucosidase, partial [Dysgonamonadaceae bacterium]|nr:alpha-L-fucosidase [Dysgonamonadaceae bacterium]